MGEGKSPRRKEFQSMDKRRGRRVTTCLLFL